MGLIDDLYMRKRRRIPAGVLAMLEGSAEEPTPEPTPEELMATPESYDPAREYEDRATRERPTYPVDTSTLPGQVIENLHATGTRRGRKRAKLGGGTLARWIAQASTGDVPLNENVAQSLHDLVYEKTMSPEHAKGAQDWTEYLIPWMPYGLGSAHFASEVPRDLREGHYGRAAWDTLLATPLAPDAKTIMELGLGFAEKTAKRAEKVAGPGAYLDPANVSRIMPTASSGLLDYLQSFVRHPGKAKHALPLALIKARGLAWAINAGVITEETANRLRELGYLPEEGTEESGRESPGAVVGRLAGAE